MKFRKILRLCALAAVLMALLCAPALAKVVSPGPDFYYLDNANVLSEALEGEIFFANKLLYDACGAQIVVVTVDSTGRQAIDDYAYDLFNEWGIGDAAKNNGFLLLLAIADDDYYARTGSGLDSKFSASTIKDYYDRYLENDFAAKRYEAGVKKFFEAVFARVATTYGADVTVSDGIAAYKEYVAQNSAASGFGGYNGTRRSSAAGGDYEGDDDSAVGIGFIVFVLLLIILIVVLSKGRRARRRVGVMPPPPPPPNAFGFGYRPSRTVYHRGPTFGGPPPRSSSRSSGPSFGGGSIFGGGGSSSRSSSSFRSSSSRSSGFGGFGGGGGGGGRSSGGGAGRGRH